MKLECVPCIKSLLMGFILYSDKKLLHHLSMYTVICNNLIYRYGLGLHLFGIKLIFPISV